jgi:hypothetical protein
VVEDEAHEPQRGARAPRLNPIGLQWGGHRLMGSSGEETVQYALASCISTVCRVLDVELIRDWNIGLSEYWGKVGHFKIAAKACALVAAPKLKELLMANQANIAFGDVAIEAGAQKHIGNHDFVPLADVADLVWRSTRPADESNHFADMDKLAESGPFRNKDLLTLCQDPANVDVDVWNQYYESIGEHAKRGALPFRIWQMYDEMVHSLRDGDVVRFVCAGGLMSHYAGDACQPLHVSQFHHGRNASESAVHSDYETKMLDRFAADMIDRVNQRLATTTATADVEGGHAAAVAIVALMRQTIEILPPLVLVQAWVDSGRPNRIANLWEALGNRTADCIAAGSLRLASLWESAWKEGNGDQIDGGDLVEIDQDALVQLYNDRAFVPSMTLADMESQHILSNGINRADKRGASSRHRSRSRVPG